MSFPTPCHCAKNLLCLLLLVVILGGCSEQKRALRHARLYGHTTVSPPIPVNAEAMADTLQVKNETINFEYALGQSGLPQSSAQRDYLQQASLAAELRGNLLALESLLSSPGGEGAGVAPPGASPPLIQRPLPARTAADAGMPSLPLSRRIQSAHNDALFARIAERMPDLLQVKKEEWEIQFLIGSLNVFPGQRTARNSRAEVQVKYELSKTTGQESGYRAHLDSSKEIIKLFSSPIVDGLLAVSGSKINFKHGGRNVEGGTSEDNLRVIPIFPVYETAAELDDSRSLEQTILILSALGQYGPAEGRAELGLLTDDLKRLVSMNQRVLVTSAPLTNDTISYRIAGNRIANPLQDKTPRLTTELQDRPLTTVTMVMIRRSAIRDANKNTLNLDMSFRGFWTVPRTWSDFLYPTRWVTGPFQKNTTRRQAWADVGDSTEDRPVRWGKYEKVLQLTHKAKTVEPPVQLSLRSTDKVTVNNRGTQIFVVQATGDAPTHFFADGLLVPHKMVGDVKVIRDDSLVEPTLTSLQFNGTGDSGLNADQRQSIASTAILIHVGLWDLLPKAAIDSLLTGISDVTDHHKKIIADMKAISKSVRDPNESPLNREWELKEEMRAVAMFAMMYGLVLEDNPQNTYLVMIPRDTLAEIRQTRKQDDSFMLSAVNMAGPMDKEITVTLNESAFAGIEDESSQTISLVLGGQPYSIKVPRGLDVPLPIYEILKEAVKPREEPKKNRSE